MFLSDGLEPLFADLSLQVSSWEAPPDEEQCDECGFLIPTADGGSLVNHHHSPACSLHRKGQWHWHWRTDR